MLRPAQMVKVHLTGLNSELEPAVEALERLRSVHIVETQDIEPGFHGGRPLSYGPRVSELLLEVRGLVKALDLQGGDPSRPFPAATLAGELEERLAELRGPVRELQARTRTNSKELEEQRQLLGRLEAFRDLGLDLSLLTGYRTLEVLVGTLEESAREELREAPPDCELFETPTLVVLFVPHKELERVEALLVRLGFKAVEPPTLTGDPLELARRASRRVADLEIELTALEAEREALALRHGQWLAAAEEYLAIEAGKSELPLRLTTSEHTFLLTGWVPEGRLGDLEQLAGHLHLHLEVDRPEPAPAPPTGEMEAVLAPSEPPVKLDNPPVVRPFELFIELFSTPRYKEVDPTLLLFLFYPFFFGFMVGDAGYGLGYFLLGGWLAKRFHYHAQMVALGRIMRLAGLWAFLFGLFLYAELFGMTLMEMGDKLGYGFEWPYHTFHKFDSDYVILMIKVTLLIGAIHLTLGRLLGFRNHSQDHSFSEALNHNISWIFLFWFILAGLFWLLKGLTLPVTGWFVVVALLILGLVMLLAGEGGIAIVEIPTALSNIISYTRILALGLSDAGLAFAFNTLGLDVVGAGGGLMLLPAFVILLLGHVLIFMLGIIGSGIHALRLQYVEFFTKFYQGGGTPFRPFGSQRRYITQT